jgi:hypothetical protein
MASKQMNQPLKINQAKHHTYWQAVLTGVLLLIICLILAGTFLQGKLKSNTESPSTTQASLQSPSLEGEKAIEHLKQQGLYNSLAEAMSIARYSINPVQQPTKLGLEAGSYYGSNSVQRYNAFFNSENLQIVPQTPNRDWQVGMRLTGYGYGERLRSVSKAELKAASNRIEYHRTVVDDSESAIIEWYENRSEGLEQGFTINAPPMQKQEGEQLVVALDLTGDLQASINSQGQAIRLSKTDGTSVLSYEKLWAKDARGQELSARMRLSGNKLLLEVDDTEAEYPVTIDPIFSEQQKFHASDAATLDQFGSSVAISGETVVVGAFSDDNAGGVDAGAAYVFLRTGNVWSQQQKLTASDAAAQDEFGYSIAISGETIVIGTRAEDNAGGVDAGSAYVFLRTGNIWNQQQKLTASDAGTSDFVGYSVAITGETIAVGAPGDNNAGGNNAGAVYIFVRTGSLWNEQQKLTASDGSENALFGNSLAISGETVVVGAPNRNLVNINNAGAAYIFVRNGSVWSQQQSLTIGDLAPSDQFGWSVDISGETVAVGARLKDITGKTNAGAAYIFVRAGNSWGQQQTLIASDGAAFDTFGSSVDIDGETVVVGAPTADVAPNNLDSGAAYVFVRTGSSWNQEQKIIASDAAGSDAFGTSVAISVGTIVIGAPLDDPPGTTDAGAVYAFACGGTGTWTEQAKNTAIDGTVGDFLGISIAISGKTIVAGAESDSNATGSFAGSAYVFVRIGSTWNLQQKIEGNDTVASDRFGHSVAISGETIVVGALSNTSAGDDAGAAYVFVRTASSWNQQQKLTASDAAVSDRFGWSLGISGETIVIGANAADTPLGGQTAGAAYVFVRTGSTWNEQQKLIPGGARIGNDFAHAVAISGETIIVGSPFETHVGGQGKVYTYVRTGNIWNEHQTLIASDGEAGDFFGFSVAIDGETLVVGAMNEDNAGGVNAGSAYVFVRTGSTWNQQQKLIASDGAASDEFGISVGISGETVVTGARFDDHAGGVNAGSAYAFVRTGSTWNQQQKLTASDAATNDTFGHAVAISGETIAVGSPIDNNARGAAYIFALTCIQPCTGITCPGDITAVAAANCTSSTGTVVTFPTPTTGNCPGATVVCSPASGSMFPVGTTTVTCTATTGSGNTASCSFIVKVFNGCLQDDTNTGNVVLFNRTTGEYRFCCGGVVLATGTGKVTTSGCNVTIEHNTADRKVLIKGDFSGNKGTALLQMPTGNTKCQITDRDTRNNSCQCGL